MAQTNISVRMDEKLKMDVGKRIGAGVGILSVLPENFDVTFQSMDQEIESAFESSVEML
ncbi:MAG: hypothetical protein K2O42_03610 [Oscillospiraceae bacterium]|nr:hypothetical protein [Oscillospiraceae bacterium]